MFAARYRKVIAGLVATGLVTTLAACSPQSMPVPTPSPTVTKAAPLPAPVDKVKSFFNKKLHSLDDPTSIWAVVDKLRPLNPLSYVPADLITPNVHYVSSPLMRPEPAAAIAKMFTASAAEGAGELQIQNAYRSFDLQTSNYNRDVAQNGKAYADNDTARPGYSEHQAGLTADVVGRPAVCSIAECFGTTPQGIWLAANAWRFGFVIRYPQGKQAVTGYIYEPWHIRYVGVELSTEMHNTGVLTLEEFFGLPDAPNYLN